LLPKSESSESEVYFTGAFERPERRVDMFASVSLRRLMIESRREERNCYKITIRL
jgi:hypothetical protein